MINDIITNENGYKFRVLTSFQFGFDLCYRIKSIDSGVEWTVSLRDIESGDFPKAFNLKDTDGFKEFEGLVSEKLAKEPKFKTIIAKHLRSGREVTVSNEGELNKFVNENSMDVEAINNVLDGKAKSHKKWSLEYAE